MIEVSPKCPDYEEEANKAHTLLVIKISFLFIPDFNIAFPTLISFL